MEHSDRIDLAGRMTLALDVLEGCREFAALVPEVRSNLAYAPPKPTHPGEVMAIAGRITVIDGRPKAVGRPQFGASSHMARLLIEVGKYNPEFRAGINFRCDPAIIVWMQTYCRDRGWAISSIDREAEPEEIREPEGASMPWKIRTAVTNAGGQVPRVFYERGGVGKEDLMVLLGPDPLTVVEDMGAIARAYGQSQVTPGKIGKIDLDTFNSFLRDRLGKADPTVRVPPATGVDAGVIDLNDAQVLLVAEDPIFTIPGQSPAMFGWYTVHIGASDIAVMGVKPRYLTYTLLMPPQTPDVEFQTIVDAIHQAAQDLDIAIVGGHTGYYPGLAAPLIGGVTVFAIAPQGGYVTAAGARPGDTVLLTKGPAIETAGLLASLREGELRQRYPGELVDAAKALCQQMTVVQDAQIAMATGGVTAMHDATEGGVIGGLFEIAQASQVGMEIDEGAFVLPESVQMVCEAFNIDPLAAIAEGSLLITCAPTAAENILQNLAAADIPASAIGQVTDDPTTRILRRRDGRTVPLAIPEQDPFWPVFFAGVAQVEEGGRV